MAFEEAPAKGLFWAATPAVLVALKAMAFGRTRPTGGQVDRDFSDVALLFEHEGKRIAQEVMDDGQMRTRMVRAAEALQREEAVEAAARELVKSGQRSSPLEAEAMVRRACLDLVAEIEAMKD